MEFRHRFPQTHSQPLLSTAQPVPNALFGARIYVSKPFGYSALEAIFTPKVRKISLSNPFAMSGLHQEITPEGWGEGVP